MSHIDIHIHLEHGETLASVLERAFERTFDLTERVAADSVSEPEDDEPIGTAVLGETVPPEPENEPPAAEKPPAEAPKKRRRTKAQKEEDERNGKESEFKKLASEHPDWSIEDIRAAMYPPKPEQGNEPPEPEEGWDTRDAEAPTNVSNLPEAPESTPETGDDWPVAPTTDDAEGDWRPPWAS